MTFSTRKKEMLKQFNDNFIGTVAAQIVWDGVANKSIDKNEDWISISIQPVTSNFASINNSRKVRHTGFFVVQIFIKPDKTTEAADILVDEIADTLEGVRTTSGIIFGATLATRVGLVDGYYQVNTFTDYKYDDQRS